MGFGTRAIRSLRPDVAVLDLKMPALDGIQLTKRLKRESHRPAIVICSVENDQSCRGCATRWSAGLCLKAFI